MKIFVADMRKQLDLFAKEQVAFHSKVNVCFGFRTLTLQMAATWQAFTLN